MVALVPHIGDDRRLRVGPAVARDAGELAQARARAVRGDEQPRGARGRVGALDRDAARSRVEAGHRASFQRDAELPRFRGQRLYQVAVLDNVGERLAGQNLAAESQEHRAHAVGEAAVAHFHVEDRLCGFCDRAPHADALEQAPRRRGDRGGARVRGPIDERIGDEDAERSAEALAQCDAEREAGEPAACDHYVGPFRGHVRAQVSPLSEQNSEIRDEFL